jgi:hypothetical protein
VSRYLIDTNILVRIVSPRDPLKPAAVRAVDTLRRRNDSLCVAPQKLLEFWAVATQPPEANGLGLEPEAAAQEVDRSRELSGRRRAADDLHALAPASRRARGPRPPGVRRPYCRGHDREQRGSYPDVQRRRLPPSSRHHGRESAESGRSSGTGSVKRRGEAGGDGPHHEVGMSSARPETDENTTVHVLSEAVHVLGAPGAFDRGSGTSTCTEFSEETTEIGDWSLPLPLPLPLPS